MDRFKFTAWNIEHSDKLVDAKASNNATKRRHAEARLEAIAEQIAALGADILFVSEGPHGEDRARDFFAEVAPDYDLVTRPSGEDADYGMKGGAGFAGRQWLWFLIRKASGIAGQLVHIDRWQDLTEANSRGEHKAGRWDVSFPEWVKAASDSPSQLQFDIARNHGHWRHPQVLQATIPSTEGETAFIEFIGCHLKSKYNDIKPEGDASDPDFFEKNPELVADLIKARVKITTECTDIRHYIEARFEADENAAIVVAGDLNDGPGKERIERRFLYHDLIGSLQGDVFFARRFLNHALFDSPEGERWSVHFEDALDPARDPHILLDHILFSQAMTRSHLGEKCLFLAQGGSGLVEHQVHHQVTSTRYKYANTSDHKPVSMTFTCQSGVPVG